MLFINNENLYIINILTKNKKTKKKKKQKLNFLFYYLIYRPDFLLFLDLGPCSLLDSLWVWDDSEEGRLFFVLLVEVDVVVETDVEQDKLLSNFAFELLICVMLIGCETLELLLSEAVSKASSLF